MPLVERACLAPSLSVATTLARVGFKRLACRSLEADARKGIACDLFMCRVVSSGKRQILLVLLENSHRGPIYRVLSRFIGDPLDVTNAVYAAHFGLPARRTHGHSSGK